jgi:RNA polymerase sigma-70 factor, ECF subfamily
VPSQREQEFLALLRQNDARLRRICRIHARDAEVRKDLYQEIVFQLWRSLPSFTGASSIHTWLYRVALNTALRQARRRANRSETTLDEERIEPEVSTASLGEADEALALDEQSERLYAAIDRLDSVDRMLITMYLDDRTYREMAEVIGISDSNVGVRLHRIRKALARSLAKETV